MLHTQWHLSENEEGDNNREHRPFPVWKDFLKQEVTALRWIPQVRPVLLSPSPRARDGKNNSSGDTKLVNTWVLINSACFCGAETGRYQLPHTDWPGFPEEPLRIAPQPLENLPVCSSEVQICTRIEFSRFYQFNATYFPPRKNNNKKLSLLLTCLNPINCTYILEAWFWSAVHHTD